MIKPSSTHYYSPKRLAVVCSGMLFTLSSFPLHAAKPAFQAPFPCGQKWDISTYANHGPDPDSLDMIRRNDEGKNAALGQPVVASAAGTVVFDKTWGSGDKEGERWVYIDHPGGWRTAYIHQSDEPGQPRLAIGRKIAQGEIIGRTDKSGSPSVHQHYTQIKDPQEDAQALAGLDWQSVLRDGTAQRAAFNGKMVATHENDPSMWDLIGEANVEKLTSKNCAGNSFVRWNRDGQNYILRYKPTTGHVRINRLSTSGDNNTQTGQESWSRRWHIIAPFYAKSGATPHIIKYDFASGKLAFAEIDPDNKGTNVIADFDIYAGWTHLVPFDIGGTPHFIAYDSRYGHFNIDRIADSNDTFSAVRKTKLGTGFTHIIPYKEGGARYVILYKGGSGNMRITRLLPGVGESGTTINLDKKWNKTRRKGWTHFAVLPREGNQYLFGYDSNTGLAKTWLIEPGGKGLQPVNQFDWPNHYASITGYNDNGSGYILASKLGNGTTRKLRLKKDASGFDEVFQGAWAKGYK